MTIRNSARDIPKHAGERTRKIGFEIACSLTINRKEIVQ